MSFSKHNHLQQFYILAFYLLFIVVESHAECSSFSESQQKLPDDLTSVGLAELASFDIEVTSPAKKSQRYGEVASAIYVLTQEDIRRSGATHVAEALRLVPGVQVARIDSHRWAITSRGFNNAFANKLLVLIDGVSIFTPLFNGVFWDQYELLVEDIDRIEVIRGPGGAIWGANAVNGVINIITCSARYTDSGLISAGGGNQERIFGSVRQGGALSEDTFYRIYSSSASRADNDLLTGGRSDDEYESYFFGTRIDSHPSKNDQLVFKVDGFYLDQRVSTLVPSLDPPFVDADGFSGDKDQIGVNVLNRWDHRISPDSEMSLQLDYLYERQRGKVFPLTRHTLHFDAQHRFAPAKGHDLSYGVEYRFYKDSIAGNFADDFDPASRSTDLFTGFVHDEISLIPDELKLLLGTKLEYNEHTDFEFMPNGRLIWTPDDHNSIWVAVSRAVAPPSRVFDDVIFPVVAFPDPATGLSTLLVGFGDRGVEAEDLIAYEVGYRSEVSKEVLVDLALFYNDYSDLQSLEPGMPFFGSIRDQVRDTLIIPFTFDNDLEGDTYGAELSVEWKPADWWRLVASYSYIKIEIASRESFNEGDEAFLENGTPNNQAHLRSHLDLGRDWEFDSILHFVDNLFQGGVSSYVDLDLRLAWNAREDLELSVVGDNLLDSSKQSSFPMFSLLLQPRSEGEYMERSLFDFSLQTGVSVEAKTP